MWSGCNYGEHAEMSCIKKFKRNKKIEKKKKSYNIIVIRLNANLELLPSKPCYNCLKHMKNNSSIKIKYIFYSIKGTIVKKKLSELLNSEKYIATRFQNKKFSKHIK